MNKRATQDDIDAAMKVKHDLMSTYPDGYYNEMSVYLIDDRVARLTMERAKSWPEDKPLKPASHALYLVNR